MPVFLNVWQQQGQLAFPLHATAFVQQESEEGGICDEGYQCVSSISQFGSGHFGKVAETAERAADSADAKDNSQIPKYEWNCPNGDLWHDMKFNTKQCSGQTEGTGAAWCLCVQRGSIDDTSETKQGEETIVGNFKAYNPTAENKSPDAKELAIVPHYPFPELGPVDFDNPYSGLGVLQLYNRAGWMERYRDLGSKVQAGLDLLRAKIDKAYIDKGALLELPGAPKTAAASEKQQESDAETLHNIRKFRLLSKNCVDIRETAAKLFNRPEQRKFAPTGVSSETKKKLLCWHALSSDNTVETACSRHNCYHGPEDVLFLERLQSLNRELLQKEAEAAAAAAAAAAGGQELPAAPTSSIPTSCDGRRGAEKGTAVWCRCSRRGALIASQGDCESTGGGRDQVCQWSPQDDACVPRVASGAAEVPGQQDEELATAGQPSTPTGQACMVGCAPAPSLRFRRAARAGRQGRSFL